MARKRLRNGLIFLGLLLVEVLIALFVHDDFVRPYLGDVLVVAVIYFFIRIFLPEGFPWLPGAVFAFALGTEVMQYFDLVDILGVGDNVFLRTLIGATFDLKDILCYAVGCALLGVYERLLHWKRG